MTHHELVGIDTTFEARVAAEKPGVRQRALAIQALLDFSTGMGSETSPEAIEHIRSLTGKQAKAARQALRLALKIARPTNTEQTVGDEPESTELAREVDSVFVSTEPASFDTIDEALLTEQYVAVPEEVAAEQLAAREEEGVVESVATEVEADIVVEGVVAEDHPKLLPLHARQWLEGQIEEDVESLTEEDIPTILEKLKAAYGPVSNSTKIDLEQLVLMRLKGMSSRDMVKQNIGVGSPASAKQTLTNYRNRVLRQKAQTTQKPMPVVMRPIPRPPKSRADLRPVSGSDPVQKTEEAETPKEAYKPDHFAAIIAAVERPTIYSREEWKESAQAYIRDRTSSVLTPGEVDALWQHLHIEDDGQYRDVGADYKAALEKLRPVFREAGKKSRASSNDDDVRARRALFNPSLNGHQNLDDIHHMLSKTNPKITPTMSERILMLGMAKMLSWANE